MKSLILGSCMLFGSAIAAQADCASELARVEGGIAKDGTLAPLEQSDSGGEVAKDGSTLPLDAPADTATSSADVEAQQEGGKTAAEEAAGGRDEAIKKARDALAAGDDAACVEALKGVDPA